MLTGEVRFLRDATGSTNVKTSLLRALAVLSRFDVPHLVCGGFAVQEHGYPRFTNDVDIIVPDVQLAHEALCRNGFDSVPGCAATLTDDELTIPWGDGKTKAESPVRVDLFPGGARLGPGPLALPMPTQVSDEPQFLTLADLISTKLSRYIGSSRCLQDRADVGKLIEANRLPREFAVAPEVQAEYQRLWDMLCHEKPITNDTRLSETEKKEAIDTLSRVTDANEPNP